MTDAEITKLIATKVMGWDKPAGCHDWYLTSVRAVRRSSAGSPKGADGDWNPLESIADAWMVVEKMRELGFWISLEGPITSDTWMVSFFRPVFARSQPAGASITVPAPRAICRAALAAIKATV